MSKYRTDYKDAKLLVSANTKRKFKVIENGDETVSFEDTTEYEEQGDAFGAEQVNAIFGGLNALNAAQADAFSTEVKYAAGEYCIYENVLYKFTAAKEAGDWKASVAEATTIGAEIEAAQKGVAALNESLDNLSGRDSSVTYADIPSMVLGVHNSLRNYRSVCKNFNYSTNSALIVGNRYSADRGRYLVMPRTSVVTYIYQVKDGETYNVRTIATTEDLASYALNSDLQYQNLTDIDYWDNTVSLLTIGTSSATHENNKTKRIYTADASTLISSPVTSGTFMALREVFYWTASNIMVRLTELRPVKGREWTNFYDGSKWSGWNSTVLNSDLENVNVKSANVAGFFGSKDMIKGDCMYMRAHAGTVPSSINGNVFAQIDFNSNILYFGADGVGNAFLSVFKASRDRNGDIIDETYAKIQKGSGKVSIASATITPSYVEVTFEKEFSSVPTVLIDSIYRPFIGVSDVTTKGFKVSGYNPYTMSAEGGYFDHAGLTDYTWVAIE